MRRLKVKLQSRYLFKILCLLAVICSLINMFFLPVKSKYLSNETEFIGQVIFYEIDGNKLKLTLKGREKLIAYYYFKIKNEKEYYKKKLELGMTLKLNGVLEVPNKSTIPNGFDYRKYLKYKQINYNLNASKIEVLENNTSILYFIKNKMNNRINKIDKKGYLKTFILGDKTILDSDIVEVFQDNGISHLFSISGMHVSLITGIIMFFLDKVSYSNWYKYGIVIPILIFYLFLTEMSASILRTVIMFIVFAINKCLNLEIKKIDLMLLVLTIAIVIDVFIIYDMGFQFSYIISFTLVVFQKKIIKSKNKILNNLITSIISFLVSFPICIYYYSKVNILGVFLNIFMIPFVSIIVFPLTLLTFVIPMLYPIYEIIIICLEKISIFFGDIKLFELVLIRPSLIVVFIYFLVIFISIYNYKYLSIFIVLVILHKSYIYLDNNATITMLDVGQGDSIFIKMQNNKGNILIDTGGMVKNNKEKWKENKKEYSIVRNKTIPYLRSLGINNIKFLVITHGDYDHMGEAINLVENFKVEKVIFNCGTYNDLEKELIKVLNKKEIKYYSCIKELNIDKNKLYFLQTKEYDNENDNSNVIYAELDGYKFMFMGDASITTEKEILNKYNLPNIDVLKVGHHGSRTSSSKTFIDKIKPKYGVISVGKNNRYGHPNDNVLDILGDSEIYRTDKDGSILFKVKNNKLQIAICPP